MAECKACKAKDEMIRGLLDRLQIGSTLGGPPTVAGASVLSDPPETPEQEEERVKEERAALQKGMKLREEFSRLHMRDPYADCKVIPAENKDEAA